MVDLMCIIIDSLLQNKKLFFLLLKAPVVIKECEHQRPSLHL